LRDGIALGVAILDGLKEGERVVASGNFFIDSQVQLSGGQSTLWSGTLDVKTTPSPEPTPRWPAAAPRAFS
jgi:hypothetical protein